MCGGVWSTAQTGAAGVEVSFSVALPLDAARLLLKHRQHSVQYQSGPQDLLGPAGSGSAGLLVRVEAGSAQGCDRVFEPL